MPLLKRFYDLLHDKLSAGVDKAQDPEDKIRAVMHSITDQAPAVRQATAEPIARYTDLLSRSEAMKVKVTALEAKARGAIGKNDEAARAYATQLVDARAEAARIDAQLATAKERADQARQHYADWKEKVDAMHSQAMDALGEAERAKAQRVYNETMRTLDSTSLDSSFAEATNAVAMEARKADAEATLDEDPTAAAVKAYDNQQRTAAVDEVLKSLAASQDAATPA